MILRDSLFGRMITDLRSAKAITTAFKKVTPRRDMYIDASVFDELWKEMYYVDGFSNQHPWRGYIILNGVNLWRRSGKR